MAFQVDQACVGCADIVHSLGNGRFLLYGFEQRFVEQVDVLVVTAQPL